MNGQLPLFGDASAPEPASETIAPFITEEDERLASQVPSWIRFGTSTWSFPGWTGIVWRGVHSGDALARSGLPAYARHPLLRAVGLDRTYYGPLRSDEAATYAAQIEESAALAPTLPPFRIVPKVWDEITTAVFPNHPRYGTRAGSINAAFLDAARFVSDVLEPSRPLLDHVGPFVFSLTPMPRGAMDERALASRVDAFLTTLERITDVSGLRFAFEVRNEELLGARWLDILAAHHAAHVFTYWTAMPSIRLQRARHRAMPPFVVLRLMLPPFTRYAEKKAALAPFNRIVEPQPDMRDDVIHVLRAAAEAGGRDAFVIVGNKAEGSAPLTIKALAARVCAELR